MKKNIFILLVGLLNCQLAVFAQQPQKRTIDVEIYSDTTIVVRDLFGADCKLYGDKIILEEDKSKELLSNDGKQREKKSYTVYGGTNEGFEKRIKELNPSTSQYVVNDNKKGVCINLSYNTLINSPLNICFYGAIHYNTLTEKTNSNGGKYWSADGWCRNKETIYSVNIIKKSPSDRPNDEGSIASDTAQTDNNPDVADNNFETIIQKHCSFLRDEIYREFGFVMAIVCLVILVSIIVFFICVKKIFNKIKKLKTEGSQSTQKSENINLEKIKQAVVSKIKSEELAQRISNEDIHSVVDRSDIQLYIQTIIAGKVDEYLRNNKIANSIPTDINGSSYQQPPVVQPELRTTKVEYRADNNCFVISENSQNKIFEIYSINGDYYYTIVNDSSIRKEMLGFITAFSGYVETRQASPIPSTVEVIRDGRLIKNGDMYIVDTNCILQVSLM